jgi:hypothetical protein
MNFKRLLDTEIGKTFISILLGLGLATLFRKACNDHSCILFRGPILDEIEDKTFDYDNDCFQYTAKTVTCKADTKKIVDINVRETTDQLPPIPGSVVNSPAAASPMFWFGGTSAPASSSTASSSTAPAKATESSQSATTPTYTISPASLITQQYALLD